jgi:hypothetical protein
LYTNATQGAPGIYYPAYVIDGFNPDDFMSASRLRAVQLPIFDGDGNPILPSQVPDIFTPGTPMRMRLSFRAWKAGEGNIMVCLLYALSSHLNYLQRPFIRVKEVYAIGKSCNGKDQEVITPEAVTPKAVTPEAEVISDSDIQPSLLDGVEESPLLRKGKHRKDVEADSHLDAPKIKIKTEVDDNVPLKINSK